MVRSDPPVRGRPGRHQVEQRARGPVQGPSASLPFPLLCLAAHLWLTAPLVSQIGKWIFFACIIVSFVLLLWEARKARAIVKSRDISYAHTNLMAHSWYALRRCVALSFTRRG